MNGNKLLTPRNSLHIYSPGGAIISMLSRGQVLVINSGQSIELGCGFLMDEYKMFDNPVLWQKQQRDEVLHVNTMGNLFEPFRSSGKLHVAFTSEAPRYSLNLKLKGKARTVLLIRQYVAYTQMYIICSVHSCHTVVYNM